MYSAGKVSAVTANTATGTATSGAASPRHAASTPPTPSGPAAARPVVSGVRATGDAAGAGGEAAAVAAGAAGDGGGDARLSADDDSAVQDMGSSSRGCSGLRPGDTPAAKPPPTPRAAGVEDP
jgi:hypothetical protein